MRSLVLSLLLVPCAAVAVAAQEVPLLVLDSPGRSGGRPTGFSDR